MPFRAVPSAWLASLRHRGASFQCDHLVHVERATKIRCALANEQLLTSVLELIAVDKHSDDAFLVDRLASWWPRSIIGCLSAALVDAQRLPDSTTLRQRGMQGKVLKEIGFMDLIGHANAEVAQDVNSVFSRLLRPHVQRLVAGHISDEFWRCLVQKYAYIVKKFPIGASTPFWRIIFNACCTSGRFGSDRGCIFGCPVGNDHMRHYLTCNKVLSVFDDIFLLGNLSGRQILHPEGLIRVGAKPLLDEVTHFKGFLIIIDCFYFVCTQHAGRCSLTTYRSIELAVASRLRGISGYNVETRRVVQLIARRSVSDSS